MELETMYLTPHFPSNWMFNPSTRWTREENKQFERALAVFDKETPERWFNIAAMIPGKSVSDVMSKYRELEEDLMEIEAGRIPIPWYLASEGGESDRDRFRKKGSAAGRGSDQERKKGVPWTEEEHRRFLKGLLKHGKGDWRNISRNFVISKTPTQVASHAQKYFIRQQLSSNSNSKDGRRRPSIHDITTRNLTDPSLPSSESNTGNRPDFGLMRTASSLCDVAPGSLGLQGKDLTPAAFGRFGVKLPGGPMFGVHPTRYRIYG